MKSAQRPPQVPTPVPTYQERKWMSALPVMFLRVRIICYAPVVPLGAVFWFFAQRRAALQTKLGNEEANHEDA
jgi:hypothetical protein